MKITHVDTFVVGTEWRNLTIVRAHTDEGLTGLGEVRMVNHTDGLLGHRRQGARPACLQPARRAREEQGQGLRQRLV